VSPYSEECPALDVGRTFQSTTNHYDQMQMARALELEKKQPRKLASPPKFVPPATELPPGTGESSVYETDATKRLREAREYYGKLSVSQPKANEDEILLKVEDVFELGEISGLEKLDFKDLMLDSEEDVESSENEGGGSEEVKEETNEEAKEEEKDKKEEEIDKKEEEIEKGEVADQEETGLKEVEVRPALDEETLEDGGKEEESENDET